MTDRRIFNLVNADVRRRCAAYIVDDAPAGWRVTVQPQAKKRSQEARYHAMVGDIAKQCIHPTIGRRLSPEQWKRLLVEAMVHVLRDEARGQGNPDPFPEGDAELLPSLDGMRIVQVSILTRNFTVKQAAAFIEHLFAYGAERDVKWSDEAAHEYEPEQA